jgi:hypothetical protein
MFHRCEPECSSFASQNALYVLAVRCQIVPHSVGRSESDVKKSDLSESDQELSDGRYRPISEHASRTLRCPISDLAL